LKRKYILKNRKEILKNILERKRILKNTKYTKQILQHLNNTNFYTINRQSRAKREKEQRQEKIPGS